ncbi:MAG: DUF4173 domain-containing protein [Lachnospiraceae bacterium]|nr:DUF4173 domain-containing protein [Lachnospiraceae bacterium]
MENQNVVSTTEGLPLQSVPNFTQPKPVTADWNDRIFGWLTFLLGFGFVYIFTSAGTEWKLKIFTVAYVLFVLAYFGCKKKRPAKEGYFWLIIVGALGLSYSEQGIIFPPIQIMALVLAAAYAVICAGGNLLERGQSSQWILVDGWNTIIVVPFYNFICHIKVLGSSGKEEGKGHMRQLLTILLGLAITLPILFIALPLLGSADQHFADLIQNMGGYFHEEFLVFLIRVLLSLPVTAYLFGLIYGSVHQRNTDRFSQEGIRETMGICRIVPNLALHTALVIISIVYILFIGLQTSYIFSAFFGLRPEMYTYAEYARRGFFELCQVAVLNLTVLTLANSFGRKSRGESKLLRVMNVVVSALTMLLIATAMSKMILYISAYGLTEKRVLTMVFMIWLLLVFTLLIIWQFRGISLVRISLIAGTVLYTLLCVLPIQTWMNEINRVYFALM